MTETQPFELELSPRPGTPVLRRVVRGRVLRPDRSEVAAPFVVLTHGYLAFMDWAFLPALAEALVARGLAVVTFNMSGGGIGPELDEFTDPAGFAHNTYEQELEDLAAVAGAAAEGHLGPLDANRAGIWGHSRGAAMCVLHAARLRAAGHEPYRALCTWASVASVGRYDLERLEEWHREGFLWVTLADGRRMRLERDLLDEFSPRPASLDVEAAAAALDLPVLLVHGARDRSVKPEEARELLEVYPAGRAELVVIDGVGHNFGARHPLTESRPPLAQALAVTAEHFARYL
ncbi:alpha/beta hydrolase family protein [Engelhardtia mirabilis]|uniref:Alpha/beta hydrolase family protein n=1 Tax=Engelhardtia mirabilis TaxID=2528011 RepID=A0A518BT02_9BACT|nr:Alpha/beta hydrolase family protein [Planctomycetes bacterium Pla133]QDV04431.1 Alpha/beta hydrolase family protein [Planctomycetes bacterium Pla86]